MSHQSEQKQKNSHTLYRFQRSPHLGFNHTQNVVNQSLCSVPLCSTGTSLFNQSLCYAVPGLAWSTNHIAVYYAVPRLTWSTNHVAVYHYAVPGLA